MGYSLWFRHIYCLMDARQRPFGHWIVFIATTDCLSEHSARNFLQQEVKYSSRMGARFSKADGPLREKVEPDNEDGVARAL